MAYKHFIPSAGYAVEMTPEYRLTVRAWCVSYLGGKCNRCGTTENLQIDHIDRNLKRFSNFASRDFVKVADEIRNCQLLCEGCHKIKTLEAKDHLRIEHGTVRMYRDQWCRCRRCKAAHNQYLRDEKERELALLHPKKRKQEQRWYAADDQKRRKRRNISRKNRVDKLKRSPLLGAVRRPETT